MSRTSTIMLITTALLAPASCSQPEAEEAATDSAAVEVAAETAPDPTEVDADHYTTEFENDHVRVLRIVYGPGEASVMHYHPASVAVYLTDHQVEFRAPDGSSEVVRAEAGQHGFAPAEQHLPRNVGDEPLELILVELKSVPAAGQAGPDPTEVDADHYTTEFENDHVRVLRIVYGPGEASVMHYHPASVAVYLTDHQVEFRAPDGSSEVVRAEAGQHGFAPAEQHLPRNVGDEPLELVLVELK